MAVSSALSQQSWPTSILVGLAILLTLLQTYQQEPESNYAELVSCALSWGTMFGLLRVIQSLSKRITSGEDHASWKYWTVAGVVAATEWLGGDMRWLWPLVTAMLVSLQRVFTRSSGPDSSKEGLLSALMSPTSITNTRRPLIATLEAVGISAVSLASLILLSDNLPTQTLGAALGTAFAWTAVFAAFKMMSASHGSDSADQGPNGEIVFGMRVAWRTAVLLAGICVLYPMLAAPQLLHWSVAVRGVLSAGQWALFFAIAKTSSWEITTSILAFSTAGLDAKFETLSFLAQGIACTLSLYQTISFVPKSCKSRVALWIFLGIPLAILVQPLRYSYFPPTDTISKGLHPIEALAYRADIQFNKMLQRQSQTLKAANEEYTRRYKRPPPPGFQHWFEYAQEHNSPIIDEFDMIDEAIRPFLSMSGEEVLGIMREVEEADGATLWGCTIQHGQWVEPCMEGAMRSLLNSFQAHIPDVKLLFNALDEPRLLSTAATNDSEWWTETTHRNVWADLNGPCEEGPKPARKSHQSPIDTRGIPFIQDPLDAIDICKHPENENLHGLWMAPSNWVVSPAKVPLLSPGRPSTMGDIVFPAQAYSQDRYMYNPESDRPFEEKTPGVYWVGSTTGNFVANDTEQEVWQQFHRQRFVRFANNIDKEVRHDQYLFQNSTTNKWESQEVYDGTRIEHHYHVRFSNIVQCEPAACQAQETYFADVMTEWAPVEESLSYTLTMDLDGNGHSGRYYQLLGSRSLPLKQTVLKEWHDERLVAWAHYVPVTLALEELPEIVRFFVEEQRGRELAKELAEKGRVWHARALRPVDMAIYMYRLILEIARLQDVGREGDFL